MPDVSSSCFRLRFVQPLQRNGCGWGATQGRPLAPANAGLTGLTALRCGIRWGFGRRGDLLGVLAGLSVRRMDWYYHCAGLVHSPRPLDLPRRKPSSIIRFCVTAPSMQRALIIALFAALAGCNQQTLLEKFATAEDQAFARQQIQLLKAGDYAAASKSVQTPALRSPGSGMR